jgi:DNA modification methylase
MPVIDQRVTEQYSIYHGDNIKVTKDLPNNSIGYSIFSPPFAELYTYSNSEEDMGNSKNYKEFFKHFTFLIEQLYRVTMPGRLISIHCIDIPAMKERDGYIGLKEFPGDIVRAFEQFNFIYHSRCTIWKDPLVEATRTKAIGLMHKQVVKDSAMIRNGLPDYIITMRKPGNNEEPIKHKRGFENYIGDREEPKAKKNDDPKYNKYSHQVFQRYADPVWLDIHQGDTLNFRIAREKEDEKHICLAGNTLILTKRGYIPIKDVIVNDDFTLTHTGNWKKIIAKKMTKKNAEVIQIRALGVPLLISTPDHKLFVRKGYGAHPKENLQRVNTEWKKAKDCLSYYVNQKLPNIIPINISKKEIWLIGRWIADGHIDYREHQFFVSIGKNKYDYFLKNIDQENIGIVNDKVGCYQIGLKKLSNACRDILFKCGKGAENKLLPLEIISLNEELSMIFLDGYLSGDGHITKSKKIYCSSVSRALLLGLSILFQRTNRICSIYAGRKERTAIIEGRKVNCKQDWILCVSNKYSFGRIMSDGAWKPVKNIEQKDNCDVWNISVEDDESYTAEGCIVKNCPLQLKVIERCVELWSNPGDTCLDPFGGIGSSPYVFIKKNRKAVSIELKKAYYDQMAKNCIKAVKELRENQTKLIND